MMRNLLISIVAPILVVSIAALTNVSVAHYLAAWPLVLLEFTGVMGNNPEGFYNQWYGTSLVVSLVVQAIVVFIILAKVTHENT